jgi:pyruvate-formate lyase
LATTTTYADAIMVDLFEAYFDAIDGRPNTKGGTYRINLLPTTVHVYFGSVIGALPDGRHAGKPLSEGISPVQGADRKGPTAVIKSAAKMDHTRTGGTLLNQKFTPQLLADDDGLTNSPSWCAPTSSWMATTSSSTWSMRPHCAPPRPIRKNIAI